MAKRHGMQETHTIGPALRGLAEAHEVLTVQNT